MENFIKITELTKKTGLSSRTLRYYEQVGLIRSVRPQFEAYRYYDDETVNRLEQIKILRKMQIPIKDILQIYQSNEISEIVNVFCRKIDEINKEVTALSELKNIINTFLQKMEEHGIKSVTAMPLLYEEMENQFQLMEQQKPVTYAQLEAVSKKLTKPVDAAIVSLPSMRMLSSIRKTPPGVSDADGFWRFIQEKGLKPGKPGSHEMFECQTNSGDAFLLRIAEDYPNQSEFTDAVFPGGLYAATNVYADEDLGERLQTLVASLDENQFYQIDYSSHEELRQPVLMEELISPDERRDLLCMYIPVKKRIANADLFEKEKEVDPHSVSIEEIEKDNPVLWKKDVPLDSITPVNGPHYQILENGEAKYIGWIRTRVLDTNVSVKLPYRVDITFKIEGSGGFQYGAEEGSLICYRGDPGVTMSMSGEYFGVNMENEASDGVWEKDPARQEAIEFRQPVFLNRYFFPGRGKIREKEYNDLTLIVGEKHLAVILNDEIRYCGVHFPYMTLDLSRDEAKNIYIGSNGQWAKYFRSISVSQLACRQKNRFKKKELLMITKQSNNLIPTLHRLVTDERGENFWFNGCARYVMECLGEKEFDYSFFAGITGDQFVQRYPKNGYMGSSLSEYMLHSTKTMCDRGDSLEYCEGDSRFIEQVFEKCGYASTFVSNKMLKKNTEMYVNTLISYIDKGLPVIFYEGIDGPVIGVFVGYEENGKKLLYITGNNDQPSSVDLDRAIDISEPDFIDKYGWLFVGEKKETRNLAEIYRKAILDLPKLMTAEGDSFYLGAKAFRVWADEIENGKYDSVKPEEFDPWMAHTDYVCTLATIGSCYHEFLEKALQLNPDLTFLNEVSRLYEQYVAMWNSAPENLEALGGGFNVTLGALQDKGRREKIAAKLRQFAEVTDEIVRVIDDGSKNCRP